MLPTQSIISLNSLTFERCAILFNLAAMNASLGALENREGSDSIKRAIGYFQVGSWYSTWHGILICHDKECRWNLFPPVGVWSQGFKSSSQPPRPSVSRLFQTYTRGTDKFMLGARSGRFLAAGYNRYVCPFKLNHQILNIYRSTETWYHRQAQSKSGRIVRSSARFGKGSFGIGGCLARLYISRCRFHSLEKRLAN